MSSANPVFSSLLVPNADASSDLSPAAADLLTRACVGAGGLQSPGTYTSEVPIAVSGALAAEPGNGGRVVGYGDLVVFERIHVLPAVKAYPFILSPQHVLVEVWNAYRDINQSVGAVNETGPAGVSIVTPYALPLSFPATVSKVFDVLVDSTGAVRADNTIQWDFTGITEPVFVLTGLRLLPFTISPDWNDGMDDGRMWMTDVMTAYDDTEQRMMLRLVPNRSIGYTASALDKREAGLLMSLLFSWQGRDYGVLLWMDGKPLQADVVAGASDILVDTTEMGLAAGDTIILITDAFNWFASLITDLTDGSMHLDTPLDRDFFANGTAVVPVIMGRVSAQVPVDRPTNDSASVKIKFDLQVIDS